MLNKYNKWISVFLSVLLIFAIFNLAIVLESEPVAASPFCCIQTTNNDYCVDSVNGNFGDAECVAGQLNDYVNCNQIDACNLETCVPAIGSCLSNYPRQQCINEGGVPYNAPKESVPECSPGCCVNNGICTVMEETLCSGEHSASIIDNFQCDQQCDGEELGCCVGTGTCDFTQGNQCVASWTSFHNGDLCSDWISCTAEPYEQHSYKACGNAYGSLEEGDSHKVYWFDSDSNRDELVEDCGFPDGTCFDSDGPGGAEDASCITTACVEECPDCEPNQLLNGEQICLTTYQGSFSNDQKSKFLKEYILECQNGEVHNIEEIFHGEKICIDEDTTDFGGEFGRRDAKFIDNPYTDCLDSGEGIALLDVFGYIPVVGAPFVSMGGYSRGANGWVNALSLNVDRCDQIDIDLANGGSVDVCDYDHDFWSPLGSCNPNYPPSKDESKCGDCGKGGDSYANLCTEQECNALGDCQFESHGFDPNSFATAAGLALGGATAIVAGNWVVCGLSAQCSNPSFWTLVSSEIWSVFGSNLFWIVYGVVVGFGAGAAAEVDEYSFSNVEDGKADLAKTYAIARSLSSRGLVDHSEGELEVGWLLGSEIIIDLARITVEYGGFSGSAFFGEWLIERAFQSTVGDAVAGLAGQEAIDVANGAIGTMYDDFALQVPSTPYEITSASQLSGNGLDTASEQFTDTITEESVEGAGSFISTTLKVLGALYTLYQASEAFNGGECSSETAYTDNEQCWQCGGPEGQWTCTSERCGILGGDNNHCEYLEFTDDSGNGECVSVDPTDFDDPVVNHMKVEVFDTEGNYVEELEQSAIGERNELVIPSSGNYDWYGVGTLRLHINTTNPDGEPERAKCRWGKENGVDFTSLPNLFNSFSYVFEDFADIELGAGDRANGGIIYYVKCEDLSGNSQGATEDFYSLEVNFGPEPDEFPPTLWTVNPFGGVNLPESTSSINVGLVVSDISGVNGCAYSQDNLEYSTMENFFNTAGSAPCPGREDSTCALYSATIPLTNGVGIQGEVDGIMSYSYHFACTDGSNSGIVYGDHQYDSYDYTVIVVPTFNVTIENPIDGQTVFTSNPLIQASTSVNTIGCEYSIDGANYEFEELGGTHYVIEHLDNLAGSPSGISHSLSVSCEDSAHNIVTETSTFYVVADGDAPYPVRVYTSGNFLKILLNEEAECKFDTEVSNFVYEDGTEMPPSFGAEHYTSLGSETYYIQCKDQFDNLGSFTVIP